MESERLELIIDTEDTYQGQDNIFYMNPNRLSLMRCVADNQFSSCQIKNSPVEALTSINFSYIVRKMKDNATCEVIIYQPISVMQEYDSKQVEANAKLAGFSDFETKEVNFVDKSGQKFKTQSLSFIKPAKNPKVTVEAQVVVTTKDKKGVAASTKPAAKGKGKETTVTTTTSTTVTTTKGTAPVTKGTTPVVAKKVGK